MKKTRSARLARRLILLLAPAAVLFLPFPFFSHPVWRGTAVFATGISLGLLLGALPRVVRAGKRGLSRGRKRGREWLARLALYGGLFLNLSYALFRFAAGVATDSSWLFAEAVYYLLLSGIRLLLLEEERHFSAPVTGDTRGALWRGGWLLLLLSLAAAGVVLLALMEERGRPYPDAVVIGAILFTACRGVAALSGLFHFRERGNAVLALAKQLSLSTALVSLFSLQYTLLLRYGENFAYRLPLNLLTGSAVVLFLGVSGALLLRRAKKQG